MVAFNIRSGLLALSTLSHLASASPYPVTGNSTSPSVTTGSASAPTSFPSVPSGISYSIPYPISLNSTFPSASATASGSGILPGPTASGAPYPISFNSTFPSATASGSAYFPGSTASEASSGIVRRKMRREISWLKEAKTPLRRSLPKRLLQAYGL